MVYARNWSEVRGSRQVWGERLSYSKPISMPYTRCVAVYVGLQSSTAVALAFTQRFGRRAIAHRLGHTGFRIRPSARPARRLCDHRSPLVPGPPARSSRDRGSAAVQPEAEKRPIRPLHGSASSRVRGSRTGFQSLSHSSAHALDWISLRIACQPQEALAHVQRRKPRTEWNVVLDPARRGAAAMLIDWLRTARGNVVRTAERDEVARRPHTVDGSMGRDSGVKAARTPRRVGARQ
eukprot:6905864-Prymnesium_polylepis.1